MLVGIMDRGTGKGVQIAPECAPRHADNLEAFIARSDIDAVMVASPSGSHLEAGLCAAAHGKHCLVEKPMEITPARVDTLIEAHRRAGTMLGGIFNTRYTEGARLLKQACEAGRFGHLTHASAVGPWWREQSYYDESNWKGTWVHDGGGALMNQGIHSIDLLQWLMGEEVASVCGHIATLAHARIEVEDTGTALLRFESGALGTLALTTSVWPGHFRTITIGGTDGTAVLADGNLLHWAFREETAHDDAVRARLLQLPGAGVGASDPSAGVDSDGHLAALTEFVAAVRSGQAPLVDGQEARKAVAIICAVYASSRQQGAPVNV
jgi:predicted dehydrogenase